MKHFEVELMYSYITVRREYRIVEAEDEKIARDLAMTDLGDLKFEIKRTMEHSPIEIENVKQLD